MKKILLIIVAVAGCVVANAQDFDLAAIAQKLAVKADSASMIMGQLNGTQAAVNHPTTEARQQLLKSFNDALGVTSKGEQYKEGNSFATEFFKVAQDMKKRTGIVMNRKAYAQAVLNRFNDTTITKRTTLASSRSVANRSKAMPSLRNSPLCTKIALTLRATLSS